MPWVGSVVPAIHVGVEQSVALEVFFEPHDLSQCPTAASRRSCLCFFAQDLHGFLRVDLTFHGQIVPP